MFINGWLKWSMVFMLVMMISVNILLKLLNCFLLFGYGFFGLFFFIFVSIWLFFEEKLFCVKIGSKKVEGGFLVKDF